MILKLLFLLLCNFAHFVRGNGAQKNEIHVPGNVTIVAYFSVHRRFNESGGCGEIQEVAGLQRVEVALQTIGEINARPGSKCRIGIIIRDTCEQDYFGDFSANTEPIIGIIGPATSEETVSFRSHVNFTLKNALHIGYAATSSQLTKTDKEGYRNFTRVVPSDEYQVQVIIGIIKNINRTDRESIAVNIIGSPKIYGQGGIDEFRKAAKNNSICIHKTEIVDGNSSLKDYEDILYDTINDTQIIVCFCDGDSLRNLTQSAKNMNASHKFIFIACDRWSERDDVLNDIRDEAEGNFFINIKSDMNNVTFDHNYTRLREKSQEAGISWIDELQKKIETKHFQNSFQDTKLPFVKQSIEEIVQHVNEKPDQSGSNFSPLLYSIDQTREQNCFIDTFYNDGEPNASHYQYEILQYQNDSGDFKFVQVGHWKNGSFKWNGSMVKHPGIEINAKCAKMCNPGQYINKSCCWRCENCSSSAIDFSETGYESRCNQCRACEYANLEHTGCEQKRRKYIPLLDAIDTSLCIIISSSGVLFTLFTAGVFYKKRRSPVVKLASTHLSFIIFCGMVLAHSCTLLLLWPPSEITCSVLKFVPSISLTMILGPMLIKVKRITIALSVAQKRLSRLENKYLSVGFLVSVSCIFIVVNLLLCLAQYFVALDENKWNSSSGLSCSHKEEKISVFCPSESLAEFNIRHSLNVFLLGYCAFYAYSARHLPENFRETKWIYMSCGATATVWVAFIVFFCGHPTTEVTEAWRQRAVSMSLVLSLSAYITLLFMYFPKLYIILVRSRENCRTFYSTVTQGAYGESRCREEILLSYMDGTADPSLMHFDNIENKTESLQSDGSQQAKTK